MNTKKTEAPDAAVEEPSPAQPKLYRLKLDCDGVFWGAEELTSAIAEEDVVLDHVPDNAPGRYRWDRERNRLDPLEPQQIKELPGPNFERALYSLALQVHQARPELVPADTIAWCAAYEKTIDGRPAHYFGDLK